MHTPQRIAVFLPSWIGDTAMATPALRALRRHFGPQARIIGIMRPYLAKVLDGSPWLSEQWYFDPRSSDRDQRRLGLVRRMLHARIDLAVLLPNSMQSALLAWFGGARRRLGYVRDGRGLLLTDRVYPQRRAGRCVDTPMVDYYLKLATAAGCGPESPHLELFTTPQDERLADAVFDRLNLARDGRLVGLNTGSSNSEAKCWPVESFGRLARRIVEQLDHDVLVFCGPRERSAAEQIVAQAGCRRVHSLAGQALDLGMTKACLRRCRTLVSTDSGPRHVAAALGRPVITLYGPTHPIVCQNPTVDAVELRLELDCIACRKKACPYGHHRCMRDLPVEQVYDAVAKVLTRGDAAWAA